MLWGSGIIHVSDFMCSVFIIINGVPKYMNWDFSEESGRRNPASSIHVTRNSHCSSFCFVNLDLFNSLFFQVACLKNGNK